MLKTTSEELDLSAGSDLPYFTYFYTYSSYFDFLYTYFDILYLFPIFI